MLTVSATYLHTKRTVTSLPNFEAKFSRVEKEIYKTARDIYGPDVWIIVEIDEGTNWYKVLMGTAAIVTIMSQAPQGFEHVVKYSKIAIENGSMIIGSITQEFDLKKSDILWSKRTTGDIKKFKSIYGKINKINKFGKKFSKEELIEIEASINKDIYNICKKLDNINDLIPLFRILPYDTLPHLPKFPEDVHMPVAALLPDVPRLEEMVAIDEKPRPRMRRRKLVYRREIGV